MSYQLRPLTTADLEWLRNLRNANRHAFFNTDLITEEAQQAWWNDRKRQNEDHYVIWFCGRPDVKGWPAERVGYFSMVPPNLSLPIFPDGRTTCCDYLNALLVVAEWQGKGVIQTAAQAFRTGISVVGYVREGNAASLRACEKLGLLNRGIYEHPQYGRIHIVQRG